MFLKIPQKKNFIAHLSSLRALRFVFYLNIFVIEYFRGIGDYSRWASVFSVDAVPTFLHFLISNNAFTVFQILFLLCCLACAFSILPKQSSFFCFLFGTGYYFLCYSTGLDNHQVHLIWHVLLVFTLFENFESFTPREFLLTVKFLFLLVFFSAGVVKTVRLGFDWFDPELATRFLARQHLYGPNSFIINDQSMNSWALKNIEMIRVFFYSVLPLELIAPLAIMSRFRFLIVFLAAFQIFAGHFLYASFYPYIGIYFFWTINETNFDRISVSG